MMFYTIIGVQTALDGGENNEITSQCEKSFRIARRRHQQNSDRCHLSG